MKSSVVVLLAIAASAFATAAGAVAFNYNAYYLVTFTAPSGPFQHCIQLTKTQQDLSDGYPKSGTWLDTDFPNTAGTWVLDGDVFHLAGPVDGSAFLTIDGRPANDDLLKAATFNYFDSSGNYLAAGSIAFEKSDASCVADSASKGEFLPSGVNRLPVH
jgi:hypothetical protein